MTTQTKRGILLKPKHEPDTTKFKLVVWYDKKLNGEFYTQFEKNSNANRKYHDSIDFIMTPNGYVTRHDEAYNKLLHHLEKWKDNIIRACLYMNDFVNDKQYLIGKFEKDETKTRLVQPDFRTYQRVGYTEKIIHDKNRPECFEIKERVIEVKEVFCYGLIGTPLGEYTIKRHKTL